MRSASHAEVLGSATFVKKSIRTLMLRTVHVNGVVQDLCRGPFLLLFAVLSRGQLKIRGHLSGGVS